MMLGESVRRRQPQRRPRARGARSWRLWLPAVLAALVVPFVIGYAMAVFVLFPEPKVAGGGIAVPVLVGRTADEAERALSSAGLGRAEVLELPHPNAPVGQVLAQSPLPGQQLPAGADVRISVSGGRPRVRVPDVAGFSAQRAEQLLRSFGFDVVAREQESDVPAGRVIGTDVPTGTESVLPATVTLFVSTGPPPPPELPPEDTLSGGPPT
ncbi:MAG TPA: PASTA domain-containing protein [Longimicrobiales bacterium]|nr:PASTA domain-containing protein [Longimicrobiales bacterium]